MGSEPDAKAGASTAKPMAGLGVGAAGGLWGWCWLWWSCLGRLTKAHRQRSKLDQQQQQGRAQQNASQSCQDRVWWAGGQSGGGHMKHAVQFVLQAWQPSEATQNIPAPHRKIRGRGQRHFAQARRTCCCANNSFAFSMTILDSGLQAAGKVGAKCLYCCAAENVP